MDEQHLPSKRWPLYVVCAVLAGVLYLATAALILNLSPAPTAPVSTPVHHSIWPNDHLMWYA